MPKSKARKPKLTRKVSKHQGTATRGAPSDACILGDIFCRIFSTSWKIVVAISVVATILASGAYFLPRPTIHAEEKPDLLSPLPVSFTITNENFIPLNDLKVSFAVCVATSKSGARIIGRKEPDRCNGPAPYGAHVVDWDRPTLLKDEKYTITTTGRHMRFAPNDEMISADMEIIIKFRPWFLPFENETQFRFVLAQKTYGPLIWAARPLY